MKIVLSDLDGTILKRGEKALNRNVLSAIEHILSQNVYFAVASGRTYVELKHFFAPFEKDIFFITNDGAETIYKEETLLDFPIKESFSSPSYALHGKYMTYLKTKDIPLTRSLLSQQHGHVMKLDNDFPDEPIYKITDYAKIKYDVLPLLYKDNSMNEYIAHPVNKGIAAKMLLAHLNIPLGESCSFGDNFNDLPLFNETGDSFAVANAHPKVKKAAKKVCRDFETEIFRLI